MTTFRYSTRDDGGEVHAGQIEAESLAAAARHLQALNIEAFDLQPAAEDAQALPKLATEASQEVVEVIAQMSAAELPLAPGLRAAAEECESEDAAAVLNHLAQRVELGEPLERVVSENSSVLSSHIGRVVTLAARSGNLGHALCELDEHHRTVRDLRLAITLGFAYPVVVSSFAILILLCLVVFLTAPFEKLCLDFGLELPQSTQLLFWWRHTGLPILGIAVTALLIAGATARALMGRAAWLRLVETVPLVGVLVGWSGVAEWASLLSVLIRHQVPVPEALRLAGDGSSNAHIGELSKELAKDVEKGHSIADALAANLGFPDTVVPIVRWGEESGMLGESFATTREIFLSRLRDRSIFLRSVFVPFLFISIGCCLQFVVGSLLMPLTSLIQGLA